MEGFTVSPNSRDHLLSDNSVSVCGEVLYEVRLDLHRRSGFDAPPQR